MSEVTLYRVQTCPEHGHQLGTGDDGSLLCREGHTVERPVTVDAIGRPSPSTGADEELVEAVARALNFEAGRQRGLTFEDDWDTLTEQERGGWRLCARAALHAYRELTG